MDENKKRDFTIGIGVTTTPNRKEYLDLCLSQIKKHTHGEYILHVHNDINYRGVAYSKNENIHALKDCDYIFLFDDDCYPESNEWVEWFVNSNQKHLLYLQDHGKRWTEFNMYDGDILLYTLETYDNCGGVFMMITKDIVDKVGYMNSAYGQYGFEHAGYSNRIFKSGFTIAPYQQLKDTNCFLYSKDYDLFSNTKSSIPFYKRERLVNQNRPIFEKEINSQQIYYPYESTI